MWALAQRSGLDLNSPYAYVMWGEYHAAASIVAEVDGELIGFIIGFRVPDSWHTVFVWQIAVDERQRGEGIGGRMLDELVERTGASIIEATVTPNNAASAALFRGLGTRHGSDVEETLAFGESLFPEGHEAEIRFRIPVHANDTTRD
jgi:L-2,4-diaminobutyric acid acetyltransferase